MPNILQPINHTAATLALNEDTHAEAWVTLNKADGMTVTLPASTGKGARYKLFVGTTFTSNCVVQVANGTDILQGGIAMSTDIGGTNLLTASTTDTITMNGSTQGGLKGSWLCFDDVASGIWALSGFVITTGTETTPFSAAVS